MQMKKQNNNRWALRSALLLFLFGTAWASAQTITGTVSSADGPLPGASIVEKGTVNGTQTDFDGNFTIELSGQSSILVISYIGFSTKEIETTGKTTISVNLEENAASLEEVVVVAYGKKKKVNLTGAVSVVDEKTLEARARGQCPTGPTRRLPQPPDNPIDGHGGTGGRNEHEHSGPHLP